MKVFLILSDVPDPKREAVHIVTHETLRIICDHGHNAALQVINRYADRPALTEREEALLADWAKLGVMVFPPLYVVDVAPPPPRVRLARLTAPIRRVLKPALLFPATFLRPEVERRIREAGSEVVLDIWSWEGLAATYGIRHVPKFAYYGNPDHKPEEARLRCPDLFDMPTRSLKGKLSLLGRRIQNAARKRLHVRMMLECAVTANNAMLDAKFYEAAGHPRSIYLQNMWPEVEEERLAGFFRRQGGRICVKIVGSIGNLGSTGNTFGLYFLGRELVPALERKFGSRPWEVHIYGEGAPSSAVARHLRRPNVKLRGWVDDIDGEICSSHLFLVANNSGPFRVGHTRFLHAWSLGACVVAHANSADSMPEIRHLETALLGRTADEIAEWVVRAVDDDTLRERIAEGGRSVFLKHFRSDVVVPRMLAEMKRLLAQRSI